MVILSLVFSLLSSSVGLRRDTSILYSRLSILILFFSSLLPINGMLENFIFSKILILFIVGFNYTSLINHVYCINVV